jgi:hypothetical protein
MRALVFCESLLSANEWKQAETIIAAADMALLALSGRMYPFLCAYGTSPKQNEKTLRK